MDDCGYGIRLSQTHKLCAWFGDKDQQQWLNLRLGSDNRPTVPSIVFVTRIDMEMCMSNLTTKHLDHLIGRRIVAVEIKGR